MIRITARSDEPIERLMRRFRNKCEKEGLIKDMRRTAYYEKPSERRRRKQLKAERRAFRESLERRGR
jgi:small subunit ribosomal protein S21